RWTLCAGVAIVGLSAVPATAKPTPAAKCLSAKVKAVAKKESAKLACEAKAAQKLVPVDEECRSKAETNFGKAFTKAESKGGCLTVGDSGALEASVNDLVMSLVGALPNGGTKDGGKCAGAKLKASGKVASAELLCHGKAALKAIAVDTECIGKAEDAFKKAFGKAEDKGGCVTVNDATQVDTTVDAFIDDVLSQLAGGSTTTTSTVPGTTTTTIAPAATVMVGAGSIGFSFVPATTTVHVGDTVRWSWVSGGHNVVSGAPCVSDGKFCSPDNTNCGSQATLPLLPMGSIYDHTFTEAGTFQFFCNPHCIAPLSLVGPILLQPQRTPPI